MTEPSEPQWVDGTELAGDIAHAFGSDSVSFEAVTPSIAFGSEQAGQAVVALQETFGLK